MAAECFRRAVGSLNADPEYKDFSVWGTAMYCWMRGTQWQQAIVRLARNIQLGVRMDLAGLDVGLAWWYAPRVQIEQYRTAVADDGPGRRLVAFLQGVERDGFAISGGSAGAAAGALCCTPSARGDVAAQVGPSRQWSWKALCR
ncbi:hypothetical protein [Kribbella rubisoli]|uniref:hypothetical protein n=1 Tax=Kribbella rubisoli TaxID=3075929 RepID=UPI00102CB179|nr:hypothetical protein [Kribbella rubisoli]